MSWLTSNISWIGIAGVLLIVASTVRIWFVRPSKLPLISGLGLLVTCGLLIAHIATSPPGGEVTVIETFKPEFRPEHVKSLSKTLRMPWSSEGAADWPFAEKMAECCTLAYLPPIEAVPAFQNLGFDRVEPMFADSMAGYIVFVEDAAIVIFRGTDDNTDWFVNLDSLTTQTPHGPIHRGFQKSYLLLYPQVAKILHERKPKHLWITGHSLGGALAIACAYDLHQSKEQEIAGVLTFGQPMLVGQSLATYIDEEFYGKYIHFVNGSDIVPRVVPSLRHCGTLVWFKSDGMHRSRPKRVSYGADSSMSLIQSEDLAIPPLSESEFESEKDRLKAANMPKALSNDQPIYEGNSPFIADHSMELYLDAIRRFLTPPTTDSPAAPFRYPAQGGIGALPGDAKELVPMAK